ncbi:hypothetical protein ACFSHQ_03550 [Gemmobacter lanyuensis]
MKARGLNPMPQYDIAGRRLDFALFGTGGSSSILKWTGDNSTKLRMADASCRTIGETIN